MKRKIRIGLILIAIMIAGTISYFTFVIIKARSDTPGTISAALHSKNIVLKKTDLSSWQLNVLLAVEDPGFYHHTGVDLTTPGAGATTITQGLVKLLYFNDFTPGFDKVKQTLIARYVLDPSVSKDDQLVLFINNVYLGNYDGKQVVGLSNAANIYYHKTIAQLTEDEYISVIAMIIAPNNFHIINKPEQNSERVMRIKKLVSGEYKPQSQMDVYYDLPPKEAK